MKIKDIVKHINNFAPTFYQEPYDNVGLLVGNENSESNSALLTLDVTEEVIDEAISLKTNLIIAHHPIVFEGLKKITGKNYIERCIIKAIKKDIAIYAAHTNIDAVANGVNGKICEKLGLVNPTILQPKKDVLYKLVTFIPIDYHERVSQAIFDCGAGHIGNYDSCSYNIEGSGTFRAGKGTMPFIGEQGKIHHEKEMRFETVFKAYQKNKILEALKRTHPYEEVAYDIYKTENIFEQAGSGMIGEFEENITEKEALKKIKKAFKCQYIKHSPLLGKKIKKVAVCGGSGSFLLKDALKTGAQLFISADFKYHQFFDAENNILIADIGHFESEQFTTEIFYDVLTKNLTNFAIHFSKVKTNPLNYF